MIHSGAFWADVLEVGTADKKIETEDNIWCILRLVETISLKFELLRKI